MAWSHAPGLLGGAPATWADHGRQLVGAATSARLVEATGDRWGYDPSIHAGCPHVAVATDSHLQTLAVVLLRGAGAGRAYAVWILAAAAAVPLLLALAARAAGGSAAAGWGTGLAGAVVLQLDGLTRLMGRSGMNGWLLAAAVVVLFTATFAALLEAPSRRRWLAALAVLPLLSAHVLCPPSVAGAFLLAVGLRLSRAGERRRALGVAALVAAAGLLVNAWWVVPFLRHLWVFEPGDWSITLAGTPRKLGPDLLSMVWPRAGYVGSTQGLRWAALLLGLWAGLRAQPAAPARAVGALAAVALVLTYFGSLVPATAMLQPYRFVIVAVFAALALVGPGLEQARTAWAAHPRARVALAALGASVALSLVFELLAAVTLPLRPVALDPDDERAVAAARRLPADRGRLLTEVMLARPYTANAVALALPDHAHTAVSGHEFYGAYGRTSWCSLPPVFLGRDPAGLDPAEVPALLERYAVAFVLTRSRFGYDLLDGAPAGTFSSVTSLGAWRLYEVARPAGWFLEGQGGLTFGPGRLSLTGLTGPVVLRWHHVRGLRAAESDEVLVTPSPVEGDPVPFIRVDPRGRAAVNLVWDG